MSPSSRTPEGRPNVCPVCGHYVRVVPSQPADDAPCPRCGHLLWFDVIPISQARRRERQPASNTQSSPIQQGGRPRAAKRRPGAFTLVDFKKAMGQMKRLGPLKRIMNWIPGMRRVADMMGDADGDPENDLKQIEGIIDAMTPAERENPELINIARRRRIAVGSGTGPADVNRLLKEFSAMAGMMEQMAQMSKLRQ